MLYQVTPGDLEIFNKTRQTGNINWFTNYYLRSADSGTWWRPVAQEQINELEITEFRDKAEKWRDGYDSLFQIWRDLKKPEYFVEVKPGNYEVVSRERHDEILTLKKYRAVQEPDYRTPTFHHNHGFFSLSWQLMMHQTKQEERVVIGGYGSGKTIFAAVEMLVWAAILKSFRGFALAPFSIQANEVYSIIKTLIAGTLYEQRFVVRSPSKPMKHFVIGNSLVGGNNTIECYPILDDPDKILTVTGDAAIVDQAEKLPDIDMVREMLGTRFRGQVAGRERIGKITYIANSADNPTLWDLYDEAEINQADVWSYSPHSAENIYLTIRDMKRYQRVVGKSIEERQRALAGKRPIGSGEYFPRESLEKCREQMLDDLLLANEEKEGWMLFRAHKIGTYRFEMPPDPDSQYLVVADPGWKNPPYRDSAAISVWKIDDFPHTPAHMVAFHWVAGNGSPLPWMNQYYEYVRKYNAIANNGYDATGNGAGYGKMTDINLLLPYPVNLGAMRKQSYITLLQKIMANGLIKMPHIEHIFAQLAKYRYPEPSENGKFRQDLVMMLLVLAACLEPRWYENLEEEVKSDYDPEDRYYRDEERYYEYER